MTFEPLYIAAPTSPPPAPRARTLVVTIEGGRLVVRPARAAERRWLSRALDTFTAARAAMAVT